MQYYDLFQEERSHERLICAYCYLFFRLCSNEDSDRKQDIQMMNKVRMGGRDQEPHIEISAEIN
jgi:hypothetical protein